MKRPKNFLFLFLLLSVVAVVLAAALHAARERGQAAWTPPVSEPAGQPVPPSPVSGSVAPGGTPSAAAQRRAKKFNDATNRFNAPDEQPQ